MTYSASDIFCDYLDCTYSPDSPVISVVSDFMFHQDVVLAFEDEKGKVFKTANDGVLKLDTKKNHSRISASGGVLMHLRTKNLFDEYLQILASSPHRVTRLDAAYDVSQDGADMLASMRRKYSKAGSVAKFGRKSLPVSYMINVRADGRETGTVYFGHRTRARTTARVYDKQNEMLTKQGLTIDPTVRYEITVRGEKDRPSPSLRDAALPESIFWNVASPELLRRPSGVPDWVPNSAFDWSGTPVVPKDVSDRIREYASFDPNLKRAIELAAEAGDEYLVFLHRQICNSIFGHNKFEIILSKKDL